MPGSREGVDRKGFCRFHYRIRAEDTLGEKMTSATTNWAIPASTELLFISSEPQYVTSNKSVLVGGMSEWQRKTIGKVLEYKWKLNKPDWDSYGSKPIGESVTYAATKLVEKI